MAIAYKDKTFSISAIAAVFTASSMGIALSTHGYDRPEELLRDADSTMYCAKGHTTARYQVFIQ